MIKEPKYLVKFTETNNDNGTVWYKVEVWMCVLVGVQPQGR